MNSEEKYKQALERARQFIEHPLQEDSANIVEYIFPELSNGEDERIRKVLLNDFKNNCSEYYCEGVNRDMIIAWLEKQGKKLDTDKVIEWLNDQACQGWIEDVEVDKFIEKFKKDFGL